MQSRASRSNSDFSLIRDTPSRPTIGLEAAGFSDGPSGSEGWEVLADTGVSCPECNQGSMLKRKSRMGKIFFSCSRYPDCKYAIWNEPVAEMCPKCAWPVLMIKTTKKRGTELVCPKKTCDFAKQIDNPDHSSSTDS